MKQCQNALPLSRINLSNNQSFHEDGMCNFLSTLECTPVMCSCKRSDLHSVGCGCVTYVSMSVHVCLLYVFLSACVHIVCVSSLLCVCVCVCVCVGFRHTQ